MSGRWRPWLFARCRLSDNGKMKKPMDVEKKRRQEMLVMEKMVHIYCRGKHKTYGGKLCAACESLLEYGQSRTAKCPRMAEKTFCSQCPRPCYQPEMQEYIRRVMKYAGPRMLLHNPVLVWKHFAAGRVRKK